MGGHDGRGEGGEGTTLLIIKHGSSESNGVTDMDERTLRLKQLAQESKEALLAFNQHESSEEAQRIAHIVQPLILLIEEGLGLPAYPVNEIA